MSFTDTAPARIWLGIFSDEEEPSFPADHEDICWAEDQFADFNAGYVREDIAAAQRGELLEAVNRLLSWERLGKQVRTEDIAFAQRAIANAPGGTL